ncbi:MAG: thioredoxin family protein, partial [Deltaproteobacteria bacterium]|nr:thioredoxin family protein [Deltaproteobacteria bacterium]
IKYFTSKTDCQLCTEVGELLTEISKLHEKVKLEKYESENNPELLEKYKIDKYPAFVVTNKEGFGDRMRFFGIPSGYEFVSLLSAIIEVGTEKVELPEEILDTVKNIDKPVHLQVFVTPTCPYCPQAVIIGHKLALLNENVTADMVEATEFPNLSNKYNVKGVPRVVVNEDGYFEGALPEAIYLDSIKKRLSGEKGNLFQQG